MEDTTRSHITAGAVSLRGDDIDTDRIIPARFLTSIVFDGLGEYVFFDDRAEARAAGRRHPFDAPGAAEAQILLVNKNFGCGSSREHAPQALARWRRGIRAIVGESFGEIFFSNCVAIGVPCVSASESAIRLLMEACERQPELELSVDLARMTVRGAGEVHPIAMPEGPRAQVLSGRWDSTAELLDARDEIRRTAGGLPYFQGWA